MVWTCGESKGNHGNLTKTMAQSKVEGKISQGRPGRQWSDTPMAE